MEASAKDKFNHVMSMLKDRLVLVAFSGGVDSSVLALLAKEAAKKVQLLYVESPLSPAEDSVAAREVAEEIGLELLTTEVDPFANPEFTPNPVDRCYVCKSTLVGEWKRVADEAGLEIVVEGTTVTELKGHRPGKRALREGGVSSPFLEAGLAKDEIREYAQEHGLSVAKRPSMACLATRIPYGIDITRQRVEMVRQVEEAAKDIFQVETIRARHHGELVRLEVGATEREKLFDIKKLNEFNEAARSLGFKYITIDVQGYRTGSMDEVFD